jgi:hypothetical protein
MLFALLAVLVALATIDRCTRLARLELVALEHRYKLFTLRDLLRQSAIEGTVDAGSRLFDFLDTSLTRAANRLMDLNAFDVIYTALTASEGTLNRVKSLNEELNRKGNGRLKAITDGFQRCLIEFLYERHRGFRSTIRVSAGATMSAQSLWTRWKKRGRVAVMADPRVSTINSYYKDDVGAAPKPA